MTTPITPIRLPLDIKAAANKRADEDGTNLTQLIIRAINEYLSYQQVKCDNCGSTHLYSEEYRCDDCGEYGCY